MRRLDLKGRKFGRLLVVDFAGIKGKKKSTYWKCLCKCGEFSEVKGGSLTSGNSNSCGCASREACSKKAYKHGMYGTRFHGIWSNIKSRCYNKKLWQYQLYGKRGIKTSWDTFDLFKKEMHRSYLLHSKKFGEKNTTIERIDNNGNYCKENCRWATRMEQSNNKRCNRVYIIDGIKLNLKQWAKKYNSNYKLAWARLSRGWEIKRALGIL